MENGKVPLLPLALDLGTSSSIHPSAINSLQIPSLLLPPNLLQEYCQLSNLDVEWVNNFLFGSMTKFGINNDSQKPTSPAPADNASLTSMVGANNVVGREGNNTNDGSLGAAGSRVTDNRKVTGRSKKSVPQRVAFHTRSADDVLDDGYRWRKYGQKAVKNSSHPRSYYRCTHHTCNVKKQIQRLATDSGIVVTTYEGKHNHPSEKLMETLAPLLKQLQLLTRF
ncbi:hypothetical protein CRG98_028650 [Punica granatum]|uniref:WRKY domain-containing protein n=2 Tax=Punica granatum TaxID=22663 RepID=A0A2I0J4T1_PUNGR|nr:hypothetical protein CRG98_028650 [Punica granatum]